MLAGLRVPASGVDAIRGWSCLDALASAGWAADEVRYVGQPGARGRGRDPRASAEDAGRAGARSTTSRLEPVVDPRAGEPLLAWAKLARRRARRGSPRPSHVDARRTRESRGSPAGARWSRAARSTDPHARSC
jgi:hypothetical protein